MTVNAFYDAVILVCAVMAVINLLLVRRRGLSGYLLACAFLVFGGSLYAFQHQAPQPVLIAGGVLVAVLLGADFFNRTRSPK